MAGIVVCGAGMGGLVTAMLLANDGHDVTVLERDPLEPPDPAVAWDTWERRGVNQFRLPHFLLPRFHDTAKSELPALVEALHAAGAHHFNMAHAVTGGMMPADPAFDVVTARRPVLESVTAAVAASVPGIDIRRGIAVAGLVSGTRSSPGIPHVTGVCTESGEQLDADLVIDATGRRSPLPRWLAAIGSPPLEEEEEDSGFVYYGRHVQSRDGTQAFGGPSNIRFGSVSLLALPGDHGTAGVGIIASSKDAALRILRHEEPWRRVLAALPGGDRVLDCEPVSPLVAMARIEDRWRRLAPGGVPVATGVLAVADSWAATNPSLGRGISLALLHAVALRDTIRKVGLDSPLALAEAFDEVTERDFTPWYRSTVWQDRHTVAAIDAAVDGVGDGSSNDPVWHAWGRVQAAARHDPMTVVPRLLNAGAMLRERPEEIVADPAIRSLLESCDADAAHDAGPSRAELLTLIGT